MKEKMYLIKVFFLIISLNIIYFPFCFPQWTDWRNVETGSRIHSDGYIDQPYVVVLQDGSWLAVFTTGAGEEGEKGQHIVATRTNNHGKSWLPPVKIEEPGRESSSWAIPFVTDFGRVYVFYTYNGDKIHSMGSNQDIREDMLGWYSYKYSDDKGSTWSERHRLPLRVTSVDRHNEWNGEVQMFWGIGKPIRLERGMMFAFTKIGTYMLEDSEGWYFFCGNINEERDPSRLKWELFPEGDVGVKNPDLGTVNAEHNIVPLSDGTIYSMHRTISGFPSESYSFDKGRSWTLPSVPRYYDGRKIKHPRACPRIWKCGKGKYLFWHHFNGGWDFENRNPAWISGGIEKDGRIIWSQPEILLYEKSKEVGSKTYMVTIVTENGPEIMFYEGNTAPRISYPDLVEQHGKYWITETNKEVGRVHEVPADFLNKLWSQFEIAEVCEKNLIFSAARKPLKAGDSFNLPAFGREKHIPGFTIDLVYRVTDLAAGREILRIEGVDGKKIILSTAGFGALKLSVIHGDDEQVFTSDPGHIKAFGDNSVSVGMDDASKVVQFVINGIVNDGGNYRQFGWGVYQGDLNWSGSSVLTLGELGTAPNAYQAMFRSVRVYDRPLINTELIGNHRANERVYDIRSREVLGDY